MLRYNKFNESKRNKGSNRYERERFSRNQNVRMTSKIVEPRGMEMEFSPRFKYIIEKISEKGNAISKDLLNVLNNGNKYDWSYLDITNKNDTISYLPNSARDMKDDDKYKTNKRQHVKAYKLIKLLFGSKYTKTDVTKFVSLYKSVFEKGPDKKQNENALLVNKIIEDTKSKKLKWIISGDQNLLTCETSIKVTENKKLILSLYIPSTEINTILTINMLSNKNKTWIKTIPGQDLKKLIDFIKTI